MQLCKQFIIKYVLDYENNNEINIMQELGQGNLFIILDLIELGNRCSSDEAENILNKALETMSIEEIVEKLAYELIGKKPDKNDEYISSDDVKSFSDVLESFYSELQTVDEKISLSEFWEMNTRYMYKYADGVKERFINTKNRQYQENYEHISMFMSALSGKLKECPQLNKDGTIHKKSRLEKILEERGI